MRTLFFLLLCTLLACSQNQQAEQVLDPTETIDLVAFLDTIWQTEQTPIRMRDSLMKIHGPESEEADHYQQIYKKNHGVNEQKVRMLLDNQGWPDKAIIGEQGNLTICNVLQHSDAEVRAAYVPMLRSAVQDQQLAPWL